jgi:hypothetical protein
MTDRLIPALSISCGALTVLYVVLVISTIFFASLQTEEMSYVRGSESTIGTLESNYYTAINKASNLSPATLGFVAPVEVKYVATAQTVSSGLTFAGN